MKITGFLVMDSYGEEIPTDPYGNNIAFNCEICGYPVFATALDNQRGSDRAHPVTCRDCGAGFFLDVRPRAQKLYIHRTDRA